MSDSDLSQHVRPNLFEIDLGAVRTFVKNIRSYVGAETTIFATLKCNAYGFGLEQVANTVVAAGVDGLAMVDRSNAIALRRCGVTAPILLYPGSPVDEAAVRAAEMHNLWLSIPDLETAKIYSRLARSPLKVAVKIDLGQERLGFPAETAPDAVATIAAMPNLTIQVLNSHPNVPADAPEDYRRWQREQFVAVCESLRRRGIEIPLRMIASSRLLSTGRDMIFNAVDPGQMLFGPLRSDGDVPWPTERQAFASLKSRLIFVRPIERTAFADRAPFPIRPGMQLGVIPIGSADGAALCHAGVVLVRGRRAPVVGSPSLEHMRIDVSEIPEAAVGDEVVLIGQQNGERITPSEVVRFQKLPRTVDLAMAIRPSVPRRYFD